MAYRDCLDWVGEGYSIARFAIEAEKRGCCRKVSGWPPWLEPGKSRVFLAHRGGLKPIEKGVIFGYFELAGADVVMSPVVGADAVRLGQGAADGQMSQRLTDLWVSELSTSLGSGKSDARKPARSKPDPDRDDLIDFIVDLLIDCDQPPMPIPGGRGVSTFQSSIEEERWCGFRPKGLELDKDTRSKVGFWWQQRSAVYLVDGLAREIDELLCELLKKLIKDALRKKGRSLATIRDLQRRLLAEAEDRPPRGGRGKRPRRRGAEVFDQAVDQAAARRGFGPAVPSALKGHCHVRGALVLFERPFPTYHQHPRAHFRSYQRIDGDNLLAQIAAYFNGEADREVELPFFIDESRPLMWPSTVALLAKKTGMGRAMARRVVESLGDLIAEELAADEDGSHKLRISGLGTFDTKLSAAREGRNPATGETIQIPAKKRIRFRATAPLKRRIEGS